MRRVSAAESTAVTGVRSSWETQRLESTDLGDVEEHGEHAAALALERRGAHEEPPRLDAAHLDLARARRPKLARAVEQLLQLGVPHDLEERHAHHVAAHEQHLAKRRVHERHVPRPVEQHHALLHALEHAAQEVALLAQLTEGAREVAGELVERLTELAGLFLLVDAEGPRAEVSLLNATRRLGQRAHERQRRPRRGLRDQRRAHRRAEQRRERRAAREPRGERERRRAEQRKERQRQGKQPPANAAAQGA
jgi:hypothetical protein